MLTDHHLNQKQDAVIPTHSRSTIKSYQAQDK